VEYGLTSAYGLTAQSDGLVTAHQVTLGAQYITQGTTYYLQVLSATATGASATGGAQQFTATGFAVTIRVVDRHNKPIKGATVTVDGQSEITSSAGVATFPNLPAGSQKLVIKSGRSSTNSTITVGKVSPKTGTYQLQAFTLTAARGGSLVPYIVVAVIALLAAGALFVPLGPLSRLLQHAGKGPKGPSGMTGAMGSGSGRGPIVPSPPTSPTTTITTPSAIPAQVISPGSSPAASVSAMPLKPGNIQLGKPKNLEPGTVIQPNEETRT